VQALGGAPKRLFIRIKYFISGNSHRRFQFFRLFELEEHMKPKFALFGLLSLAAVGLASQPASAIPGGLPHASQITNVEQVRWVCTPWGRCWWRPNYYGAYGFYPVPRFGYRHWGHGYWGHRGWRRW
jgi:hypothetical protein